MGLSESHTGISLNVNDIWAEWKSYIIKMSTTYDFFTPPHQQIFIEFFNFHVFFSISVHIAYASCPQLYWRPPGSGEGQERPALDQDQAPRPHLEEGHQAKVPRSIYSSSTWSFLREKGKNTIWYYLHLVKCCTFQSLEFRDRTYRKTPSVWWFALCCFNSPPIYFVYRMFIDFSITGAINVNASKVTASSSNSKSKAKSKIAGQLKGSWVQVSSWVFGYRSAHE